MSVEWGIRDVSISPHLFLSMQVSVTEREPVQALREADILAKLTPAVRHLADLGPVTEPGVCQQICHCFDEAAAPKRAQPYR